MKSTDMTDISQLKPFKAIHLPEDTEITSELIESLIDYNESVRVPRYEILREYYLGQTPIMERQREETQSNNKVTHDFAGYITDILTGIFIGKPVKYTVSRELKESMDKIQSNFNHNDEQDENHELAKMASKLGVAYELVYSNEEGHIKFNEIDPANLVYVWDDKINPEPLFALYYRTEIDPLDLEAEDGDRVVTVYGRESNLYFRESDGTFILENEEMNLFDGKVQVVEFGNNEEYLGDYEKVISLIDAYNKTRSDTTNDFEEFTDAFLVLAGMEQTDESDLRTLKKNRAILLSGDGSQKAEWLTKDINHSALEGHLERLEADIHKFAKVPNLSDENFAGNSSGVAMAYKLMAMRQVIAAKERKFKKGLQDRLELVVTGERAKAQVGQDFTYRDIDIVFTTNVPINIKENVEMVNILSGLVSQETWLSELYCIDNPNAEMEKIENETNAYDIRDEMAKLELEEVDQAETKEGD